MSTFQKLEEGLEEQQKTSSVVEIKEDKKKIYVVDTNAIIDNPECLKQLGDGGNCVLLPTPILYELDKHAGNKKELQKFIPARQARRIIKDLILGGKLYHDPREAVKEDAKPSFDNGGKFSWTGASYRPVNSKMEADDQIVEQILETRKNLEGLTNAELKLITEDTGLMAKASSQRIAVESLRMGKVEVKNPEQVYAGMKELFVSRDLLDKFIKSGEGLERYLEISDLKSDLENLGKKLDARLIWNQGLILTDADKTNDSIPTLYNPQNGRLECLKYAIGVNERDLERTKEEVASKGIKNELFYQYFYLKTFFDTKPRNIEQLYYFDHLINPDINFIVVNGRSGTGKTRLAMAAALHHLLKEDNLLHQLREKSSQFGKNDVLRKKGYRKGILILKPEVASIDYGFLPGGLDDKIDPYLTPFYDEINDMTEKYNRHGFNFLEHLKSNKILQSEATAFLRGRSLGDRITVIDELQNGNRALAKLYVSRLDHGSKNIAMGDINQIDNEHVGVNNNALTLLTDVIQKRPKPEVAVVKLQKSQRLTMAAEYEDLLSNWLKPQRYR